MQVLKDKKLKGQLSVREDLYGKSAKAAAKVEKVNSRYPNLFYYLSALCFKLLIVFTNPQVQQDTLDSIKPENLGFLCEL